MNGCEIPTGPGLCGITSEGGTGNRRTFITQHPAPGRKREGPGVCGHRISAA